METLKITVTNTTPSSSLRPVTGGVPLPMGWAPDGTGWVLRDSAGALVPCQGTVLARWKDGSARWVLLDFQSAPVAGETLCYSLGLGSGVAPEGPVRRTPGDEVGLESGALRVTVPRRGLLEIAGVGVGLTARDEQGERFEAVVESAEVEVAGPVRSMIAIRGALRSASGARLVGFRTWVSVYAGLSRVLLEPLVLMDSDDGCIQKIRDLKLEVRPVGGVETAAIGGEPGWSGDAMESVRLFQIDDRNFRMEGTDGRGGQAPGWAEIAWKEGCVAVAVRDFWQQWPKSLEVSDGSLAVGLFPEFDAGAFDHMQPWYKYDYLWTRNLYRLRCGQARRWQIWLDVEGGGEDICWNANDPLVPAADPAQAISTGAWGDIAPAGSSGMEEYDPWVERMFDSYTSAVLESRDTGAMNWGDWFGERKCNWGNLEYDTSRQILLQFARTGNPKYLHAGATAARHTSEVDVIHHVNDALKSYFLDEVCASYRNRSIIEASPIRPGMMHAHCVGHVGGFHGVEKIKELFLSFSQSEGGNPYLCLDPFNVGHVFAQGMAYCYFLTGDPWIRETLGRVGDNLTRLIIDRQLVFTGRPCAGRELGWPMQALAAVYEMDYDEACLAAMKTLADDALEEQDPHCGGWLQELFGGHCDCVKRKHVGEAAFITSIRLNGLVRYWTLSGDERIPEAVRRGIDNMNEDKWRDEKSGWRYTSCPSSMFSGQPGVSMMAMASAVRLFGDPEHKRILARAFRALLERFPARGPGAGKSFSSTLFGCAEAACALADACES